MHRNHFLSLSAAIATVGIFAGRSVAPAAGSVIVANTQDASLSDTDGDNQGNDIFGAGGQHTLVGEATTDVNETRYWVPFTLNAQQRTDIASASTIKLQLYLYGGTANITNFTVDIIGIPNQTSAEASKSDFEIAGTIVADDAFSSSSTENTFYQFDVTPFVKSQAATPNSVIVFRLQVDPATLPNDDGLLNKFSFDTVNNNTVSHRPQLLVIPEPGSLTLLGLGGLVLLSGKRRRR